MDTNALMLSLVFGTIGSGMFMYGKRAGRPVPLGVGLSLIVIPYFIPNVIVLLLVCCGLTALPWIFRYA